MNATMQSLVDNTINTHMRNIRKKFERVIRASPPSKANMATATAGGRPVARRRSGPSLATKLMPGAALLASHFSLCQLLAMEQFLIQAAQAQLLTAEGISTLLNGRDGLFNDLPLSAEGYASLYATPARPFASMPETGTGRPAERRLAFGADPDTGNRPDGSFDLILGDRADQLYAVLRILDRDRPGGSRRPSPGQRGSRAPYLPGRQRRPRTDPAHLLRPRRPHGLRHGREPRFARTGSRTIAFKASLRPPIREKATW